MALAPDVSASTDPYPIEDEGTPIDAPGEENATKSDEAPPAHRDGPTAVGHAAPHRT